LLACIIEDLDNKDTHMNSTPKLPSVVKGDVLANVLTKIAQMNSDITNTSEQLTGLNINEVKIVNEISKVISEWKKYSEELFASVEDLCSGQELIVSGITTCLPLCEAINQCLSKLVSLLRFSKVTGEEGIKFHPLSPETTDPWGGIIKIVKKVNLSGDNEDLNYVLRARNIEQEISVALSQISKLSIAEAKITGLEKTLGTRLKEIAMQNARLAELENALSQSSMLPTPRSNAKSVISSEEVHNLKEENRVLSEAMEVLGVKVDDYEREIRLLKEQQKSKVFGKRAIQSIPTKNLNQGTILSSISKVGLGNPQNGPQDSINYLSLEASLFRPALRLALSEVSIWKSKSINNVLLKLPGLQLAHESAQTSNISSLRKKLMLANGEFREVKSSVTITDLSQIENNHCGRGGTVSIQSRLLPLDKIKASSAMVRIEEATAAARLIISQLPRGNGVKLPMVDLINNPTLRNKKILGRVSFPGKESGKVIPFVITQKSEIINLHSTLLQCHGNMAAPHSRVKMVY